MSTYIDSRFPGPDPYEAMPKPTFPVHSDDITDGDELPKGDISPHLSWTAPEGTKSIAITCFDPDAPTASGYWHWAAFNIPASISEIPRGAGTLEDLGIDGVVTLKGDSGIRGFYGPNPPAGHTPHRYLFAVHAVDVEKLDIDPDATPTVLGFNLFFHSLGRAIVWGWHENK